MSSSSNGEEIPHWQQQQQHQQLPPPTPAVQFYSNSTPQASNVYHSAPHRPTHPDLLQHQQAPATSLAATSQSSSSSSLSSLANGLLVQSFYHRAAMFPPPPSATTEGESPLTPSALIGEHENLFLPRSNSFYEANKHALAAAPPPPPPPSMGPPVPRHPTPVLVGGVYAPWPPITMETSMLPPPSLNTPRSAMPAPAEEESEEKRTKRLERNRESARKCRWKKKERLRTLGAKVTECHAHIELQRRHLIHTMIPALQQCRRTQMTEANAAAVLRHTGPSSPLMRSVLEFQYSALRDLVLPQYQRFLLWLSRQPEFFYTTGKTQSGGKSSKQVGEELDGDRTLASANDTARLWPLWCAELKLSVDQEERWLQQYKKQAADATAIVETVHTPMAMAVTTTEHLGRAVGALSHRLAQREERTLSTILQPAQLVRYQSWLAQHRGKMVPWTTTADDTAKEQLSLQDVSRRLSEVLRISSTSPTSSEEGKECSAA
jgi:bZIP transcription factor